MEVHNRWYEDTAKVISFYQGTLTQKEARRFKLDLLRRVAGRVAGFSEECGYCQIFQQEIAQLLQDLGNLSLLSEGARQGHARMIKNAVKHLQHDHKLITKRHYIGLGAALGTGIGVAIGAGMGSVGGGIPIGVAIGVVIGSYLDSRAKKADRVI
ncbi:MAG: hypothetical protein QGI95_02945 [Dehalococcoidales bacterium]|jgi:hypothetical protein|nr:hypothetical protein [Dehalococcoidales bacterium]MDP6576528.1 hypothetical protein [Dehalococcoidales bacterium]MDP6825069.1 hypothetical protein [Dehalococcoidales bacterium]